MTTTTQTETSTRRALPGSVDAGLLVLRLVLGAVLIAHGAQKVFAFGLGGTAESFAQMGVPLAVVAGPFVAFLELLGGVAIVVGAATKIIGVLVAIQMAVALFLVHLPGGFFVDGGGIEFVLLIGGAALALALTGAGRYSVDGAIAGRQQAA